VGYFTQTDNSYLDSPNGLTNAEFRVLMCIIRLTIGYQGRRKYKIPYSQITKMSAITGVSKICNALKEKEFIDFENVNGKSSVITLLKPVTSVNGLQKKPITSINDTHSVSEPHPSTQFNGSRGAKENFTENLNKDDLFLEFKKIYPAEKFDDTAFDAWQLLTLQDREIAVAVMEYQNNGWAGREVQFVPKASNWLLERRFDNKDVRKSYEDKIRRKKETIERRKYIEEADQNSASDEEKKEILSNWKNQ